jgi:glycosyltransferase involved in cell wall biosynthesis
MDIGIAPYPHNDKFYFSPIKVYEYMAAGLPVVASRIGQISTLIEHEKTGLLYEPGDTQALVSALERLINNFDWTTMLGWKARETVLENHTWDARVEKILEIADINTSLRSHAITGTG